MVGLFAVIALVGIVGLARSAGLLSDEAPTVGLGESRDEVTPRAAQASEGEVVDTSKMTQAEKEKLYFKQIGSELATKRGGSSDARKKRKAGKKRK